MNINGWMSGSNSTLDQVMSQRASFEGDSPSEKALQGRRLATNMRQQEVGKNAARELKLNAEETEESLEEQLAKTLEEKKAAEKTQAQTEAQRVAQKAQGEGSPSASTSSQGDKVDFSEAGQVAAQRVTVARSPTPAQISTPAPMVEASTPTMVRAATPQPEQVRVTV